MVWEANGQNQPWPVQRDTAVFYRPLHSQATLNIRRACVCVLPEEGPEPEGTQGGQEGSCCCWEENQMQGIAAGSPGQCALLDLTTQNTEEQ